MRYIVFFLGCISLTFGEEVLVSIPDGTLRGTLDQSWKAPFHAFLKVPFAKPPVGKFRFQAPQPNDKWEGVLDATVEGPSCYQLTLDHANESEDCLHLNVYTPQNPKNKSLPVLVYLHGGAFSKGKKDMTEYGPQYLMENDDMIIVCMNYRLGPFGFLSTGDTVIPGNNGLKDQLLALKWVQKNIKYFNGDPNKVTIMGQSAGAASVTYHLMSPKSNGLFRAAIAVSGSLLCPWSYQRQPKENALTLARYLNSNFNKSTTSQELAEFLQALSIKDLVKALKSCPPVDENQTLNGFLFDPVIEPEHDDAFVTELQYSAIKNGHMSKVPLMMGINSEELIIYAIDQQRYKNHQKYYDTNITALVNENMRISDRQILQEVGNEIKKMYTSTTLQDDVTSLVKFYDDVAFYLPIVTHAKLQSQYSDVFFYQFSYYGKLGGDMIAIPGLGRVTHGADLPYLWSQDGKTNLYSYPAKDVQTSERFRTLVKNFVKQLNPTPEKSELFENLTWPKVTPDNVQYFDIDESLSIKTNPKGNRISKWTEIYEKYAVKPYDTF